MKKILLSITYFLAAIFSIAAQTLDGTSYYGEKAGKDTFNKFTPVHDSLTGVKSLESFGSDAQYTAADYAGPVIVSPPVLQGAASAGKTISLYGTTLNGGNYGDGGGGTINKFNASTSTLTVVRSLERYPAYVPALANFVQASDGKLYGLASGGGIANAGGIFSLDPITSGYKKLMDFDDKNGAYPTGSLVQASNGKLYGMTVLGGKNNLGVIFSFDPVTSTYTKLKDLGHTIGASPYGSLIEANDKLLYGMTHHGGKNGLGVIFSFDPATLTYTKLKDFNDTDGAYPFGSLVQAGNGKLFGMTFSGGLKRKGVIFSYDPLTLTYTRLKDFDKLHGVSPYGNLIQAKDGKMYGMTYSGGNNGGGVVFSYDPLSSAYTKLKEFDEMNENTPWGSLVQAGDGRLYGMTFFGGNDNVGVLFSYDPSTSTYEKRKDFNTDDGKYPQGSLLQISDGKLYGMTSTGGIANGGVIFSFNPSGNIYTKLAQLGISEMGKDVSGSLTHAGDGKLYGTMREGGTNNKGVIFSYDLVSSTFAKLKDFDSTDGTNPGSLTLANDGRLYGTTYRGGRSNSGVIYSFDPFTSIYKKLEDFDRTKGRFPQGSLIQATDGMLYGTAFGNNDEWNNDEYVIFSFDPASSTYTRRRSFTKLKDGFVPGRNLVQAGDGKLYGMAEGLKANTGVIFSFDPATSGYKKLKEISAWEHSPFGNLVQAWDGKLYGMTYFGGNSFIFSFDPTSSAYRKLYDFRYIDGAYPRGSLMQASDGKLYGMTSSGGNADKGSIFSFDPNTSTYTKLLDYRGINGANPGNGSVFIEVNDSLANLPPSVDLTTPANNSTFLAGGDVYLTAPASDSDGTISKVEFYNYNTLLYTATDTPYTFKWQSVPARNYVLSAKATDNSGLASFSEPVRISVVPNMPPIVDIINPPNNHVFSEGETIHLLAAARDMDGRIIKVEFYNDTILLATERKLPYTYQWQNVPAGTYTITAVAQDNWGAVTISAPVTLSVIAPAKPGVSSRPYLPEIKAGTKGEVSLQLTPNPVRNILNISTTGLQRNKKLAISVLSASGVLVKTFQINGSAKTIKLNISSLTSGMYILKVQGGVTTIIRRFVKW